MIRAVLLDIEGTTSSLDFVRQVLFPYAREHLVRFIEQRRGDAEVEAELREVVRLASAEGASAENAVASLERWMAQDRKATPLKALQGLLWDDAFRRGVFAAHVYPEVPEALAAWRGRGLAVYIYSSGSVRAQRAYFRSSTAGDLTSLIDGWFDTNVGSKSEPASYRAIAEAVRLAPSELVFLSDSQAELDAARIAGLSTVGLLRPAHVLGDHPAATGFDQPPLATLGQFTLELATTQTHAARSALRSEKEVVELARHCHARGWASATSGNFSVRMERERIAITASGIDKGRLTTADVVQVDLQGRSLAGARPSAETPLHVALYRRSPELGAVVHTHSVAATVLSRRFSRQGSLRLAGYEMAKAVASAQGAEPPELLLPIIANQQDTLALAEVVNRRLEEAPALGYLVVGHGLTTWGDNAAHARRRVEALEFMLACELELLRA